MWTLAPSTQISGTCNSLRKDTRLDKQLTYSYVRQISEAFSTNT